MNKVIVFVISSLSGKGGMERVATLLAGILVKEYCVTIITRVNNADDTCWFAINSQVKIIKVDGNLFSFLNSVQKFIKANKPEYVVSHNMGKMTLALSLLSFNRHSSQLISLEHVANITSPRYVQVLKPFLYRNVNKVVVLSKDDELAYKAFHNSVFKVINPCPFEFQKNAKYDSNSKKIISIGRLTYQKGFDLLLQAWAIVEKEVPDWYYEVYGDGEDLDMLEKMKKDLGIERLSFKGFTSNVEEVYSGASFFVLSSRFEGFGMVLIEAHTFGIPTISFNCPHGPSDIIIDNYNGKLVSNGDVLKLAKSIQELIENQGQRERFSKNALESVKAYSKENIINNWNKVFNG